MTACTPTAASARRQRRASVLAALLALSCWAAPAAFAGGGAQSDPQPTAQASPGAAPVATPPARPDDVASMDAILAAVYDVISGPKGAPRDWDRMRSLFIPGARLVPVLRDASGNTVAKVLTVEDYIRIGGPYLEKEGFYERELHREVDRFGAAAQVFSTYASFHAADDAEPFQRDINSFQLFFDGTRWWVVGIYWQDEHEGLPIPPRYGG